MRHADRGSATVFLAVAATALLLMAGLVVDGGGKVRAAQRADRIAAEAGRAAGQQLDLTAAISGDRPRVEVGRALQAARRFLARAGVGGDAWVSADRRTIEVQAVTTTSTVFLGLVGVDRLAAHGRATVELVPGVREEDP
jgi:Flp pilus assembly protein TadG